MCTPLRNEIFYYEVKFMFAKIRSLGLFGLNSFPVDVEIDISRGKKAVNVYELHCAHA